MPRTISSASRTSHFATDLRFAHRCSELKTLSVAADEVADFHSCSGRDGDGVLRVSRAIPCSHAASAIARDLRFRTIGIDEADSKVCIGRGQHPLHAISADPIVAIADLPTECADIGRGMFDSDDQKIVAAGGRFYKCNGDCGGRNWRSHCADCSKADDHAPPSRTASSCLSRGWRRLTVRLDGAINRTLCLTRYRDGKQFPQLLPMLVRRHPHRVALEGDDEISMPRRIEQSPLPIGMTHLADDMPQRYAGLLQRAHMFALVHQQSGRWRQSRQELRQFAFQDHPRVGVNLGLLQGDRNIEINRQGSSPPR